MSMWLLDDPINYSVPQLEMIAMESKPVLQINPSVMVSNNFTRCIDVETDEQDNFVGIAVYSGDNHIYYFTELTNPLKYVLSQVNLIGHNIKGDAKWLKQWGVNVKPTQLVADTMIMSYVMNSTKDSHHLKDLAKEFLGMEWSTYNQMVHPDPEHPRKKVTLDQQPVERVAEYCSMDCLATYRLWELFNKKMNTAQKKILDEIEMPLLRILYEMELNGINIDVDYLKQLDGEYSEELSLLQQKLEDLGEGVNFNSPKQLKPFLEKLLGYPVEDTSKVTLQKYKYNEFVSILLDYKRKKKLHSTYIKPFTELSTLPKIHTRFNQVVSHKNSDEAAKGISTTRLSSSGPNLQNIPVHGEDGQAIRKLFIPEKGKTLIVADYNQIEYRLLAHFSQEPRLLEAFKNGDDVHKATIAALLNKPIKDVTKEERGLGKTLAYAALYGAGSRRVAMTAKITEEMAIDFLEKYWKVLPRVRSWISRVKFEAKVKKGVYTMSGRWIPLPGIKSGNKFEQFHWERAAVNYPIQGSAAEVIKLAMIGCRKKEYKPLINVHDELLFNSENIEKDSAAIKEIMENVVKLDVPLEVSIGTGETWGDGKK